MAEQKFQRRLHRSRRIGTIRGVFLAGVYFSFIAASLGFILDALEVDVAESVLDGLKTIASSLTVVFIAGVFVCTRFLSYLEVDLYFYSIESRLGGRLKGLT